MTLLQQIQTEAVGDDVDLAVILRKCRVLAQRLKNEEFKKWVDWELNGYPSIGSLPDYRRLDFCICCGNFINARGDKMSNAQIPVLKIPEQFREFLTTMPFMPGISRLQEDAKQTASGVLKYVWPPDMSRFLANEFYENFFLMEAWRAIPVSTITGILDTIRNRILNFVLDIESENPNAGEAIMTDAPIPPQKVEQIFHTHIAGDVANMAVGSHSFSQNVIQQGDFDGLAKFIKSIGGTKTDCQELKTAIEADGKPTGKGYGKKVAGWLGGMATKAAEGSLKVGVDIAGKVISEKLKQYGL